MSETNKPLERPLSPHLQVYRLPYNAIMSISGRIVGIGLCLSLVAMLITFVAVVWNLVLFDDVMSFLKMPYMKYLLLAWAFAVFFYLGNGVRHVLWSMGIGVNQEAGIKTGNAVLLLSLIGTILLWKLTCGCWSNDYEAAPVTAEVQAEIDAAQNENKQGAQE